MISPPMPDARKKPCSICRRWFRPDPRVGQRQRACSRADCQAAQRRKTQAGWRARHPDYFIARRLQERRARDQPPEPLRWPRPLSRLPWDLAQDQLRKTRSRCEQTRPGARYATGVSPTGSARRAVARAASRATEAVISFVGQLGQQTPIVVVPVAQQPDGYLVIDGYKRIAALQQLGRDTVEAVIWDGSRGFAAGSIVAFGRNEGVLWKKVASYKGRLEPRSAQLRRADADFAWWEAAKIGEEEKGNHKNSEEFLVSGHRCACQSGKTAVGL